ncbi:hypothetical protein EVAR_34110_1 [Eumeta japonica]|uniref:Uncharacterized protein n=1 Tax=Eumeta variegata TaxID=151549 RepID=A0A4C1WMH6_EUMVA|nr:hypothetical protein EVAR_34110_1 [Eumeta japonica]
MVAGLCKQCRDQRLEVWTNGSQELNDCALPARADFQKFLRSSRRAHLPWSSGLKAFFVRNFTSGRLRLGSGAIYEYDSLDLERSVLTLSSRSVYTL